MSNLPAFPINWKQLFALDWKALLAKSPLFGFLAGGLFCPLENPSLIESLTCGLIYGGALFAFKKIAQADASNNVLKFGLTSVLQQFLMIILVISPLMFYKQGAFVAQNVIGMIAIAYLILVLTRLISSFYVWTGVTK